MPLTDLVRQRAGNIGDPNRQFQGPITGFSGKGTLRHRLAITQHQSEQSLGEKKFELASKQQVETGRPTGAISLV